MLKFWEELVEREDRVLCEQGDPRLPYTYSWSWIPIEIIKNIDNKISKSNASLSSCGIGGRDDKDKYKQLVDVLKDLNKISMDDFWEKNRKAQERIDRRHHKGRFEK